MEKLDYPSGPWTGFFDYGKGAHPFPMDLILNFSGGRITGEGHDPVGGFVISGEYTDGGECHWTKTYPNSHEVSYRGFRDGKGIWGTWEIRFYSCGGFHIWPLGEKGEEVAESVEEELSLEALLPISTNAVSQPVRSK